MRISQRSNAQLKLALEPPKRKFDVDTEAIERARIFAGLTYQQLAEKARIDRATLADFLKGRRSPTLGTIHRVIRCLELSPADVFRFPANPSQDRAA